MNPNSEIYVKLLHNLHNEVLAMDNSNEFQQNQQQQQEEAIANELSRITSLYMKVLSVLRSFGNNPLCFTKVKFGNTNITYRRFDIKMISWGTLYSICAQAFYIGGFAALCYRCFTGAYQPSVIPGSGMTARHGSDISNALVTAFFIIFFMTCCVGALVSFFCNGRLANFLNQWKQFVLLFHKTFPNQTIDLKTLELRSNTMLSVTMLICLTYLIWAPYVFRRCLFDFDEQCTWLEREQSFMFTGFGCASVLNLTWEQYKLMLMMQTTNEAFGQIGKALSIHMENGKFVHSSMLKDLFKLVYLVRAQVQRIMSICGISQLFILFYLFGLTIIIWMMFFQLSGGDLSMSLVVIIASIGVVQLSRFCVTAVVSESILKREKAIMENVSEIRPRTIKDQIEIQIFVNLLTKKPSEVVLNDFITFRRSLVLAIFSNSTSYLIAFQQLLDVQSSGVSFNSTTTTS